MQIEISKKVTTSAEYQKFFKDEIALVLKECKRQDDKWGSNRTLHPLQWMAILTEEVGEVAKNINDGHQDPTQMDLINYKEELVQCAAVAIQALKNINKYK